MKRPTLKWLLLLLLAIVLFYWKILFTRQFSLFTAYEGANVIYSWYHFFVSSLKHGILPLWDPYTQSGRSFVGEMQTALFYPLKWLLVLLPFSRRGLLSPSAFQQFFVFVHFLAGCFMFALIRELKLSRFSAFVAAVCFSLSGFVGRVPWPYMLDATIWLPLICLFLLRAMKAERLGRAIFYAAVTGLALGLVVLAGGIHIAIMDVLLVVGAAIYMAFQSERGPAGLPLRENPLARNALIVLVTGAVSFLAAAVQLLPSIEYSRLSERYLDNVTVLPALQKIPYAFVNVIFWPRSILGFIVAVPFNGAVGQAELFSTYFGLLPLLFVIIGIWKHWDNPWIRYLTGLAVLAFFYSLGPFSLLHGLLYSLVPFLWIAPEAARFIYLTHFCMAILAAFGVDTLFRETAAPDSFRSLLRMAKWVVIAAAVAIAVPAFYGKPDLNEWVALSFLLMLTAFGLFVYIVRGHRHRTAQFLVVALILWDVGAFNWGITSKIEAAKAGRDHFEALMKSAAVAGFLKSRPGLFRIQVLADAAPNIGEVYGVPSVGGMAATMLTDYERFINGVPHSVDLLNVRYFVKPKSVAEPGAVYEDDNWKVYENPNCYPRAWVVHETAVEPVAEKLRSRLGEPGFDPHRTALLAAPLGESLEAKEGDAAEEVVFENYQAKRLELKVRAEKRGLLVLSEVDYPGWQATVNGAPARIYKADGLFRGIVVPAGQSRVVLRYAPRSVLAGAILSFLAFSATLLVAAVICVQARRRRSAKEAAGAGT